MRSFSLALIIALLVGPYVIAADMQPKTIYALAINL
jgi:hypothetical protein